MPTDLIPFSFESHEVRVVMLEQSPWWIAMDVAGVLDYSDAEAMTRRLDDDEVQNLQIVGFGPRGVAVINESGLYSAILGSRKADAKKFKKWVTSEVLPSIRKTGQYRLEDDATPRDPVTIRRDDELETYELEFESFPIRVKINGAGEPWFHLHDVCRVLGYTDVRAAQLKYCTNRSTSQRARTLGGVRYQNFGALGVIFRLAAHSTSARTDDFERWLVDTALPALKSRSGLVCLDPVHELKALLQQPEIAAYVQQLLPNAAPADAPSDEPPALTRPADEPEWQRILHVITEEIDQGHYPFPYAYRLFNGEKCLLIRPAHIMEYLENAPHLADFYASLYLQSDRVLKRELQRNQALLALRIDPVIGGCRLSHAVAIDLAALRT